MRKANFRFAGVTALLLVVAMVLLAYEYHLPIRDPDGVAVPTYIRFPIIVLLAVLVDVLPRGFWRTRRAPLQVFKECTAVFRERWPWSHIWFAVAGLGTWYVSYAAFRNLKSYVPFVNPEIHDKTLSRIDKAMFGGHDPAQLLHSIFGTGWAAHFFSFVYVAWIVLVPVSLAVALVWTRRTGAGSWYVTAIAIDWALGVATYFMVPTLGPIYSRPGDFASLPHTYVTTLQETMFSDRHAVLADPFATNSVQTIAAFASLHVGIMITVCVMAELIPLHKAIRITAWVFLVLTELSTVYLGWHFFVDTLGGVVVGAAAVWIAALGTGNHVGLRPKLMEKADLAPPHVLVVTDKDV